MIAYLLDMHAHLLFTIVLCFGSLALWGLVNAIRRQAVSGGFICGLWIGELLLIAQFLIGMVLLLSGLRPYQTVMHILYGVISAIVLPVALAYSRDRSIGQQQLILAMTCLLLCGITLRALATGRGPEV